MKKLIFAMATSALLFSFTDAHATYKGTGKYDNADHTDCPPGDGNCLDVVVVTPHYSDEVVIGVNNGTISTLLNTDPGLYAALTNGKDQLTVSYIDGVKNGIYNMGILHSGVIAPGHVILLFGTGVVNDNNYDVDYNMATSN